MIRPASRFELWAAATSWLIAHALLHLWEVAVGICSPSVIARDFPAVTLPAYGVGLAHQPTFGLIMMQAKNSFMSFIYQMDSAWISALSAVMGSLVGAFTSFVTTYANQRS